MKESQWWRKIDKYGSGKSSVSETTEITFRLAELPNAMWDKPTGVFGN
jgi:hypothetical protein